MSDQVPVQNLNRPQSQGQTPALIMKSGHKRRPIEARQRASHGANARALAGKWERERAGEWERERESEGGWRRVTFHRFVARGVAMNTPAMTDAPTVPSLLSIRT